MDEMLINGKMMEELMNSSNGVADNTAEDMLQVLKGELAMDTANQVNEAALIKQQEMAFQEDLKKLWLHSWSLFTYLWYLINSPYIELYSWVNYQNLSGS